jgi:hypothetical protein
VESPLRADREPRYKAVADSKKGSCACSCGGYLGA